MQKLFSIIPVLALLFVTGCGDDDKTNSLIALKVLNQAGVLVSVEGTWTSCEMMDLPATNWELLTITFAGSGGTVSILEEFSDAACTNPVLPQTTNNGTFSFVTDSSKTVSWDASGNPDALVFPDNGGTTVTATTATISINFPGFSFSDETVMVVDTASTPNNLYSKDADDSATLDASGYPNDISSQEPLVKQ